MKVEARAPSTESVLFKVHAIKADTFKNLAKSIASKLKLKNQCSFIAAMHYDDPLLGDSVSFEGSIKVNEILYRIAVILAPASEDAEQALDDNDAVLSNDAYALCVTIRNKAFIRRRDRNNDVTTAEFSASHVSTIESINTGNDLPLAISKSKIPEYIAHVVMSNESNRTSPGHNKSLS